MWYVHETEHYKSIAFKVWFLGQQHQYHLRTCCNCKIWVPSQTCWFGASGGVSPAFVFSKLYSDLDAGLSWEALLCKKSNKEYIQKKWICEKNLPYGVPGKKSVARNWEGMWGNFWGDLLRVCWLQDVHFDKIHKSTQT